MTRSIFDPGSGSTERSGNTFMPPEAQDRSKIPPDAVDGKLEADERAELGGDQVVEEGLDAIDMGDSTDDAGPDVGGAGTAPDA